MAEDRILGDKVSKEDYERQDFTYYCEQCSHFDSDKIRCTMGYNAQNHLKKIQDERYQKSGKIAFCRFLEID